MTSSAHRLVFFPSFVIYVQIILVKHVLLSHFFFFTIKQEITEISRKSLLFFTEGKFSFSSSFLINRTQKQKQDTSASLGKFPSIFVKLFKLFILEGDKIY